MRRRWKAQLKYSDAGSEQNAATFDEPPSVEPQVLRCSLITYQRLQEEIIELESAKRRLRRRVNQLHTDEQLLARRLDQLRPRDPGT